MRWLGAVPHDEVPALLARLDVLVLPSAWPDGAAFRAESSETVLIGWTAMGLYEISRKRDRIALSRLAQPEAAR